MKESVISLMYDSVSRIDRRTLPRPYKPRSKYYNPYLHLDEIVPEDIRNIPTFPFNEEHSERWCYTCKVFVSISEYRRGYGSCRNCLKRTTNEKRDENYRKNYDFSLEQYNEMFKAQGGRCASCRRKETRLDSRTKMVKNLSVDHDHKTGRIRGLLCSGCNTALGLLEESQARTKALLGYMKRMQ